MAISVVHGGKWSSTGSMGLNHRDIRVEKPKSDRSQNEHKIGRGGFLSKRLFGRPSGQWSSTGSGGLIQAQASPDETVKVGRASQNL
jgi:hypothetical protein